MADECPKMKLRQEVTCSICLDYFTDPYTVDCGHNFCRVCIARCLPEPPAEATCPQCRARIQPQNFSANRDMARFVEISKQLSRHREREAGKGMCETHQEPLKYFCRDDEVRICSVCDKSEGHEGHDTIPVEAAALELKELIFSCLDHVREQRDKASDYKQNTEEEFHLLKLKISEGKDKILATFIVLREFLLDAEIRVANEMRKLENELTEIMEEKMSSVMEKLSSFEYILENMAEMCLLPEDELLQNAGNHLQRWTKERFDKPTAYSPSLKWRIWELCDLHNFMEVSMHQIKTLFDSGYHLQYQKVNVALDPATAHPKLVVSEDCKIVRWVNQDRAVPDNPRRFNFCPCVLGCEGFDSGRLYWDVYVGLEGNWAIGVARGSVECKGEVVLSSEKGIYAIGKYGDRYFAFEESNIAFPWKPLKPMRIRVSLDYVGAGVGFADANQAAELFAFREDSFGDEKLYPFFWLEKEGQLKLHS